MKVVTDKVDLFVNEPEVFLNTKIPNIYINHEKVIPLKFLEQALNLPEEVNQDLKDFIFTNLKDISYYNNKIIQFEITYLNNLLNIVINKNNNSLCIDFKHVTSAEYLNEKYNIEEKTKELNQILENIDKTIIAYGYKFEYHIKSNNKRNTFIYANSSNYDFKVELLNKVIPMIQLYEEKVSVIYESVS